MNPVRLLPMLIVPLLGLNATSLQNIITFDAPGAVNTFPLGGNSGGDIVGYFSSATGPNVGFLYSASSGSFTILGIPGGEAVYPGGITNSGEIAGTYSTQTINNHFFLRLPNGQYTTFDYPATGYLGSFVSINNHGDLAGSFAPSGQDYLGFVRSADTGMYTTFRIAGASETEVFGINDSNQVVG